MTSDLGGGAHGHLGLVLTPAEYALVSAILYVRPGHSGTLTLPAGPGVTNLHREWGMEPTAPSHITSHKSRDQIHFFSRVTPIFV